MTLVELIADLSRYGVELWAEGEQLGYKAPRGVLTPALLAALKQHKAELLPRLREGSGRSASWYPLSHGQKALWVLHQLDPQSDAYNVHFAARLNETLDLAALKRALQALIDRHASLRTTYTEIDGVPFLQVHKQADLCFTVIDTSMLDQEEFDHRLAEECRLPLDLEQGPLMRVKLFTRSAHEHVLLLTLHHIALDYWSLAVMLDELSALYHTGAPPPAPPPPELQYTDYTRWQTEMLAGPEGERLWTYWQKQLAGSQPTLNLPIDRPRPSVPTYRGATHAFKLSEELTSRLTAIADAEGTTLYTILLAAFHALLYRYTGQKDILVGSPTSGRVRAQFEGIVGYFVNPVVVRARLDADLTFADLLRQVRDTTLAAFDHQDHPFALLAQRLESTHDASRSSLFQAMFAFQKAPRLEEQGLSQFMMGDAGTRLQLGELTMESLGITQMEGQFDLTLSTINVEGVISGWLTYSTELFDATTTARMVEHFRSLVEAAAAGPELPVASLPLLSESERHLAIEWNDTRADYPVEPSLAELFEQQVERAPDSVALEFGSETLSYGELNRRANQLARHLRSLGVGVESRVGIYLERSPWLMVAVLGALKAGGTYVPLDPSYPAERLEFMLADSGASVLLTLDQMIERAAEWLSSGAATVVRLDVDWEQVARCSGANFSGGASGDCLAYVIYTSGSTGTPKGVCVPQRGVSRLVLNTNYVSLGPSDVIAQISNFSFDAVTFEMWGALLNGGRLAWLSKEEVLSPRELGVRLREHSVTVLLMTTAVFNEVAREEPRCFAEVREMLFGGEACDPRSIRAVLESGGAPQRLLHVYGPTEGTTFATWELVREVSEGATTVPIGGPVANTEVYVCDEQLQAVPVGISGEFYIGGEGLARGYLNHAELTAERFVPDPFAVAAGGRLYRTGDLVRWLRDGKVEFLGRMDHQVKVRGFRVELGEIEALLREHEAVREVVVMAREEVAGDKRLVAYVLLSETAATTTVELRQYLKGRLPEYMVPSAYVVLESLPLTANGKVDRSRLPAPEQTRAELGEAYVGPRTALEEALCGIWSEVLNVERVGIYDNFFELGGHSLLATQAASRMRTLAGVEVPLRWLFERPTVGELAPRVADELKGGAVAVAPPVARVARSEGEGLPLSYAQQRLWFLSQLEPDSPAYNVPLALRLEGMLDVPALAQSLNEVVRRHEVLRSRVEAAGGQPVQVVGPPDACLSVVDLSGMSARDALCHRLAMDEALLPFDLMRGPVMRPSLLRVNEQEHVLLLTMHHIATDGWSLEVFGRELEALYETFATGLPSPLGELPVQYSDFAVWQRDRLQGEVLDEQLGYWRQQLEGAPPVIELPTNRARPAVAGWRGATESFHIPLHVCRQLKELSRREGATLYMTLLAAFQTLLHRYTQQFDIVVGSPVANRNRAEVEGLIGLFVNMLVLRADLSGNPTFRELLGRVREAALEAYVHQELPFGKLVEELGIEQDISRNPLFQVALALQDGPMLTLKLKKLSASQIKFEISTVRFDLEFHLWEVPEGLSGLLAYSTELFDATTAARMVEHFRSLVEAAAASPELPVASLPLLSESERHLAIEWNDTKADYAYESSLAELFEQQVERAPDSVAVAFASETLSYGELNRRANQLARHLRSLGVGVESRVGIYLERSPWLMVAVLGVLKAGGTYVPLDPSYPAERLAFMLADSDASVLLTLDPDVERAAEWLSDSAATVVRLDGEWEQVARCSGANFSGGASGDCLAYVIYTSGSTGTPKGVCVPQRGVSRLVLNTNYVSLGPDDVVAQISNFSFDAVTFEMWGALLNGGRLAWLSKEEALSPRELGVRLREHSVTALFMTTALFNEVAREEPRCFAEVRDVLFGGEACDPRSIRAVLESGGAPQRLLHVYGPTEGTTFATWELVREVSEGATTVPIGGPVANTEVYVCDEQLQAVPVGISGEFYIGGEGLARGYLNQPELTAERFVPDPFAAAAGDRLYRTGDQVRWQRDGKVEFLGRMDHQVKVRGFRVELGEIEALLREHEAVREVVVMAREEVAGDKRLVAYVLLSEEATTTTAELRQYLKGRLPEYMVPSAFVVLESLPLTANGKVDRSRLPAPEQTRAELGEAYVGPRTPLEEALCGIWSEVLNVERVGVFDNFFELGGHSLLATQAASRMRTLAGVEVPLRWLFERPTVGELAPRVADELRGGAVAVAPPVERVTRSEGEGLPLSYAQQRLWFLSQLEPDSPAYNIHAGLRLSGPLNTTALAQSLNEVARRHESLRTVFVMTAAGEPAQVISPALHMSMALTDLRGLSEEQQQATTRRLAVEEAALPFDLVHGPVVRATLVRLSSDEQVLFLTMHHIASDGWSLGVLVQEMTTLREAFAIGEQSPLDELPVQYGDFAVWQRKWLKGEVLDEHLDYWRRRLEDAPPLLELPADHSRPPIASFRGATLPIRISTELTWTLKELSRREGVTLYMTLLAIYQALLSRYTGQVDIVVGSPIANRNRAEIEALIGFFVNTLVLRTDLSGNPTFRELLGRVRETTLEAYAHQDLPFEELVQELNPERNLSYHPLYQTMFSLQNGLLPEWERRDEDLNLLELEIATARFDLELYLRESEEGLSGFLGYSTDLFDATTAARMVEHFQSLVEATVVHPELPLASLPLLSESERQLAIEWNDTHADYAYESSLAELFEQQVALAPDSVAVEFGSETLSYGELNRRANQLARHLESLGVGPDVLVGLCVERSVEMVIGLLGILKAGGAYLALDADYPAERLQFMIEDAGAGVILTQQRLSAALREDAVDQVVCLDADWIEIAHRGETNLGVALSPENLAYVTYTSGSTGTPKGVGITQRNVARLVKQQTYANFDIEAVFLQAAPLAFDASTFEIWGSLLNGARLVVMPPGLSSLDGLGDVLRQHEVTTLWLTAGLFHLMVDERLAELHTLRRLLAGGDSLSPPHVGKFLREAGHGCMLVNGYGPTESTTFTCCHAMRADQQIDSSVPIGRPIANTRVYVCDEQLQAVPVGVAGEFYIGGEGLARGYLNQPELTAERFVPDPFAVDGGGRLYWTGDRARWLPSGEVEFLGRVDHQVKVRGFRVELGEIEAALGQHEAVREVVVTARDEERGGKRLIAYVVLASDQSPTGSALQGFLKQQLPEYMVPSAFVVLESLPLTANGKVDRNRLPAPEQTELGEAYVGPRTPLEEALCGIWSEVLNVERVGVFDNFFELGGHSLLATQAASRMRTLAGVEVPLRWLFERPTVGELAPRVADELRGGAVVVPPPVERVARSQGEGLPLSYAQQRLWFLSQLEPDSPAYNVPLALRLEGMLDVPALAQSLNEVVRRHEVLRSRVEAAGEQPVQVVGPPDICLRVVDLSGLNEGARAESERRLVAEEARSPFELSQELPLRVTLLRLGEREQVLLLTMHHIAADGWSLGVLARELTSLYEAYKDGLVSPLPEMPVQYSDFAVWQRDWLQSEVLAEQLDYWQGQLAGAPDSLELPADWPRPNIQGWRAGTVSFALDQPLCERLRAMSRREGATLYMTLLAAFKTLLHRYTGQTDIVVGSPVAGRTRAEVEGVIGFFVNTLVLRTDFAGGPSFRELLGRVREESLEAYVHQEVPFERLVEELQPERDLGRTPLLQVLFALQNFAPEELRLEGLSVSPVAAEGETAKFDLSLYMQESDNGLVGSFVYRADLFERGRMERMAGHFERLVAAVIDDPERAVSQVALLPEGERRQLLVEWNDTGNSTAQPVCLHELFEQQSQLKPDHVAVVSAGEALTYSELNVRADRLACQLRRQGVGPEQVVGLCLDRGFELVVGMLAVLKAGGAYLPLDPTYPGERLALMVQDSGAHLLLTQRRLVGALSQCDDAQLLCIEDVREAPAELDQDIEKPVVHVSAHNLAYLIYTSGSTGTPKGVAITHASAGALLEWVRQTFATDHLSRMLASTSACFDLSVFELFAPLTSGGTVVLARDALQLPDLAQEDVTLLNTVPSAARELLRMGGVPRSVSCVCLAGEELPRELTEGLYNLGHVEQVWNLYGPSEDTTYTTGGVVARGARKPLIGRGVLGTRLYMVDSEMGPMPVGVGGELYIGGEGLARGYLKRADLTAERFVPNPFAETGGERLYRTGDLARWQANGEVEFLGRVDHQVKVRGFRVEPGGIEAALSELAWVREAVVVAREEASGGKRLVAYVVGEGKNELSSERLRAALRGRLPEYLVPSAFVALETLPLTPNGKVDRSRLPAPEQTRAELGEAYVGPRTPLEEALCGIWSEVLGVERVGVFDNFFELGGHSLLATQATSRIRSLARVEVPLRWMFERPTVAELAGGIEQEIRGGASRTTAPVVRVERRAGERVVLSYAQQRLWFLSQLEPDSPAYNIHAGFRLRGELNAEALAQSLDEVMRRHESLRTVFATSEVGEPMQVVMPALGLGMAVTDLRGLGEERREAVCRRLATEEAARPFDLGRGPVVRGRLVRVDEEEHVLLLTMHHIASDGWSLGVLLREAATVYKAFSRGTASMLVELPVQYADFAVWQREWLRGEVLDEQLGYWRRRLEGAPPLLELPADGPRPAVASWRGGVESFLIPGAVCKQLKELSRREGVTLYMTLLAAFQALLSRYTHQTDIVVGSPSAGRNRVEVEPLIGFFVNTLILRTDLSGDPDFRELLGRVRETTLGAYVHQEVPFEKLVEELQPERDLRQTPLLQVMFAFQNFEPEEVRLEGVEVNRLQAGGEAAKFDLSLYMREAEEGLVGSFVYRADLFAAARMARMARHLGQVLEAVATEGQQRVSQLGLLTEAECQQVAEWNDTGNVYGGDECLHELFEAQAARTPDALAIVAADRQLTFAALNARANQLAHFLRHCGVGPDTPVAFCLERSTDLLIALLAVLKAGGAYLPLDPEQPPARVAHQLAEAGVPILLTHGQWADRWPGFTGLVLALDEPRPAWLRQPTTNPAQTSGPEHLAYCIYTSGSTGRPKGIGVTHRGAVNYTRAVTERLGLESESGAAGMHLATVTTVAADLGNTCIFASLAGGGCLHLVSREESMGAEEFASYLRHEPVEVLKIVPSHLSALVSSEGVGVLGGLRALALGGEALSWELAAAVSGASERIRLLNHYGPAEATVGSLTYSVEMNGSGIVQGATVPIGRPLANTQAYVLDPHLRPAPVGVAGELYLGGHGLARGYLNHPELTAERFVPDPLSEVTGARLYRTGDVARWLPGGEIEFLGRVDQQVKVRGFRVELGEIEAVLREHAGVSEAVVVAREEAPGDKRLVAYVVDAGGAATGELRRYLRDRLPEYMVPSVFVDLDALPLTPNGKVDRRRLPEPDQTRPELAEAYVAPRTPLEEALCAIWSEVLGVERVGVHDNFFELGGHSLLLTQVISRVRENLKIEVPMRTFFQGPTVDGLVVAITQLQAARKEVGDIEQLLEQLDRLSEEELQALIEKETISESHLDRVQL